MIRVAVLDDWHNAFDADPAIVKLRERAEVEVYTEPLLPPQRKPALESVEIVIALRERTRFDAAFFADAPSLKLLVQTGRPGPHLDLDAATKAGVVVSNAPGGSPASTVELTFGLMFALLRHIPRGDSAVRAGQWVVLPVGQSVEGKTLGLIGMGRIGSKVAAIASEAFGMNVLVWSLNMTPDRASQVGAQAASFEEVMSQSDVVSVHLTFNDSTRNLVDASKLNLMKPSAFFINTSRARVTDEAELVRMLQARRIAGAALDVFEQEPLPAGHPLTALDNVVMTPHVGWPADSAYKAFATSCSRNISEYLDSGTAPNIANPQ